MECPTVYVDEPEDLHEAWASLSRLLEQIKGLFFLIASTTDLETNVDEEEVVIAVNHCSLLGQELSEEADRRAETLRKVVRNYSEDKPAAKPEEKQPDVDTATGEVNCGN